MDARTELEDKIARNWIWGALILPLGLIATNVTAILASAHFLH